MELSCCLSLSVHTLKICFLLVIRLVVRNICSYCLEHPATLPQSSRNCPGQVHVGLCWNFHFNHRPKFSLFGSRCMENCWFVPKPGVERSVRALSALLQLGGSGCRGQPRARVLEGSNCCCGSSVHGSSERAVEFRCVCQQQHQEIRKAEESTQYIYFSILLWEVGFSSSVFWFVCFALGFFFCCWKYFMMILQISLLF